MSTMSWRVVVACVLAGCISPVMHFGGGKTGKEAQRDTMAGLGPARLVTGEKWAGEVATKKIRVWADNQYRTQNRQWQQSFEQPLELANLVVEPILGVRFVAEYVAWERHEPGSTLGDDMAALQERDAGEDVFAVVGLTSSLPLVSATFDELGLAMIGGRHMVLRGYADLEERKLYANAFPDLRPEERELALVHLRHHKTAVVLLHELGHVLGVGHETESTTIMNAMYSNHATAFSAQARAIMLRSVDQRLHRKSSAPDDEPPPVVQQAAVPKLEPQAPKVHHAPITIRVTKKSVTIVDGKPVKPDALDAMLKAAFDEDPDTKIIINEDRNVPTGAVGALLDRAKAIGLTKFSFGWSGQ
jgi:biopolymer transport protein ExbD